MHAAGAPCWKALPKQVTQPMVAPFNGAIAVATHAASPRHPTAVLMTLPSEFKIAVSLAAHLVVTAAVVVGAAVVPGVAAPADTRPTTAKEAITGAIDLMCLRGLQLGR